jgi:DNA polymerase bacteriophage-type
LAEGMLRVEDAGYEMICSVHDELISEADMEHGSVEEFEGLMSALPDWAKGCPVAAEGYRAERYRK